MQNVAYYGTHHITSHHITSHQVDVQMLTVEPTALHATIQAWLAWLLKILSKKMLLPRAVCRISLHPLNMSLFWEHI